MLTSANLWIVTQKLNILEINSTQMSTGYNCCWILPGLFLTSDKRQFPINVVWHWSSDILFSEL